jgi:hypothetical protein
MEIKVFKEINIICENFKKMRKIINFFFIKKRVNSKGFQLIFNKQVLHP